MTAEEKYSENANYSARKGGSAHKRVHRVIDNDMESKDENSGEEQKIMDPGAIEQSPGMVFSSRNNGPAGIGKMSEYAETGIYIDPN